ncbi:MFS transporter [Companilactobacillus alimentarius]
MKKEVRTNKQRFGIALPIILLTYFMIILDNSIIFTSTVKIANDLSLNNQSLSWITNAYALTFGGLLLFSGKAGDVFGRKRVYLIGLAIFSVSSLLVGLSNSAAMIISMRAVQGIGSSILAPSTLALLMDNYSGKMRTKAIGYYGATAGLGSSFGLVIGGIIASYWSWRVGFFLNFPIGIAMLLLSIKYLRSEKTYAEKIDILGTIFSILGISALVYSIDGTNYRGLSLIVAIVSLILFVFQENKSSEPIMPLTLFKNSERSFAYLARFAYMGFAVSYFFLTPLAMQRVYGFSPLGSALGFLPETIPQFIFATVETRLSTKISNSKLLITGMVITFIGVLATAILGIGSGYVLSIAIPMIFVGIGQAFVLSPLTVSGVSHTTPEMTGSASGIVNTVHQIGGSVGLSVVVTLVSRYSNPAMSYNHAMIWITVLVGIALIFSLGIIIFNNRKKLKSN